MMQVMLVQQEDGVRLGQQSIDEAIEILLYLLNFEFVLLLGIPYLFVMVDLLLEERIVVH